MDLFYRIVGFLIVNKRATRPQIAEALGVSVRKVNRIICPSPSDSMGTQLRSCYFDQVDGYIGRGSHTNPAVFRVSPNVLTP